MEVALSGVEWKEWRLSEVGEPVIDVELRDIFVTAGERQLP